MSNTERIRIILVKRNNMSEAELARKLEMTPQNLNLKMKKDDFKVNELVKIAKTLDCTYESAFIFNDTGEKV